MSSPSQLQDLTTSTQRNRGALRQGELLPPLLTLEFEQEIHRRLLNGDANALSELADASFPRLRAWLRRSVPRISDLRLYDEAAADAILNYGKRPASYNSVRAPLASYLRMSAHGDLLNLMRREGRHQQLAQPFTETVEEDAPANISGHGPRRPAGENQVTTDCRSTQPEYRKRRFWHPAEPHRRQSSPYCRGCAPGTCRTSSYRRREPLLVHVSSDAVSVQSRRE